MSLDKGKKNGKVGNGRLMSFFILAWTILQEKKTFMSQKKKSCICQLGSGTKHLGQVLPHDLSYWC